LEINITRKIYLTKVTRNLLTKSLTRDVINDLIEISSALNYHIANLIIDENIKLFYSRYLARDQIKIMENLSLGNFIIL
jgi:hypothetical protein